MGPIGVIKLKGRVNYIKSVKFLVEEYPQNSGKMVPAAKIVVECTTDSGDIIEDYFYSIINEDPGFTQGTLLGLNLQIQKMREDREKESKIVTLLKEEETKEKTSQLTIDQDEVTIT